MARTKPLVCPLGSRPLSQRIQQDPGFVMINIREPSEAEKPLDDYHRAPMLNESSLLLELPGEIRNRVYQIVAASTPWSLEPDLPTTDLPGVAVAVWNKKGCKMMSKSGLVCANRQINQEY